MKKIINNYQYYTFNYNSGFQTFYIQFYLKLKKKKLHHTWLNV